MMMSSAVVDTPVVKPSKRSSLLSKLRHGLHPKRKSSETLIMEVEDSASENSSSSRSDALLETPRMAGGCLKIPTQAQSVAEAYEPPVGLSTSASSVSFGEMQVLIFGLQLGDNPSVSVGPPLAMGNQLCARLSLQIDAYEETRPPRRHKQELAVPKPIREDWLRDEGYSRGECRQAEEAILAIKKSRKTAASSLKSVFQVRLFAAKKQPRRNSTLRK